MKIALASLFLAFPLLGLSDDLPPITKSLVEKLNDWEDDKRDSVSKEIAGKRKEVIAIMTRHLSEATKSGNLEGALAIKKEIQRLQQSDVLESNKVDDHGSSELSFENTTWKGTSDKILGATVEFQPLGKMKVTVPGAPRPWGSWTYRSTGKALYITPTDSDEIRTKLSKGDTRIELPGWGEMELVPKPG